MNCIAIDDEPLALQLLKSYIEKIDFLQLENLFTDGLQGKEYLENHPVDLLFLDIQMPDITGIQLFSSLKEKPLVIFTTAFSNYAAEGFNLDAVDYLVKPFHFERFEKAVNKAKELQEFRLNKTKENDFLFVKYDYQWNKIYFNDIVLIEALDDYIKIYQKDTHPILIHMSMKAIMEKLPESLFLRVHRSYIVSIDKIKSWNKNSIQISDQEITISNTYQKQVQEVLESRLK
ncbi:LytR/AlgR family response regulator transcription factor [Rhizosphaericola mali]|nr:response regulator transcription factor [Rhizosphaericola mali]